MLLGVEYGDLAAGLRRLSPEFRSVVQAVVLDGLTTKEAGRLLGVRENTVKTRLHRAKAQLRADAHRAAGGMAMTTRTHDWHADPALLSSYLAGALDAVTGASVEQHVNRCQTCRNAVASLLEPQLVERTWAGIRDAVERPSLPLPPSGSPAAAGSRSRPPCCSPPRLRCAAPGWSVPSCRSPSPPSPPIVVRRDGARPVPPRGAAGAGARSRRRLRTAPGSARGAGRHRALTDAPG